MAIIITQAANVIIHKTRAASLTAQGMTNYRLDLAILFEFCFAILLIYPKPIGEALNTRGIASPHFAVPAMIYFSVLILYDETRKIFVRRGIYKDPKSK